MCGIIGVCSPTTKENLEVTLLGVRYLRRRGPEGKGIGFINPFTGSIVSTRTGASNGRRESEDASFILRANEIAHDIRARMAWGQTRYITDERYDDPRITEANTQPIHLAFDGLEGLTSQSLGVHNGNIRNKSKLEEQINPKAPSQATVDSRFLIEFFMQCIRKNDGDYWTAAEQVMKVLITIDGAASVGYSDGRNLIAWRDAKGYRPLVFGKVKDSTVVVSENGFFDEMAAIFGREKVKYERALEPGEMILIDKDGKIQTRRLVDIEKQGGKITPCEFEDIYVKDNIDKDNIDKGLVSERRRKLGELLADFYRSELSGIDAVVPVIKSGLNYAEGFAKASGLPYKNVLRKPEINEGDRYFLMIKTERKHSFVVDGGVGGLSIAVTDDSIVRGTTIVELYAALKDAGAKTIKFFSGWPPKFFQCEYGIDFTRKELIAHALIENGLIMYEEGKEVKYDVQRVNSEVTKLIRERVKKTYGDKYGEVGDLNIFFATTGMIRETSSTITQCLYCITGER